MLLCSVCDWLLVFWRGNTVSRLLSFSCCFVNMYFTDPRWVECLISSHFIKTARVGLVLVSLKHVICTKTVHSLLAWINMAHCSLSYGSVGFFLLTVWWFSKSGTIYLLQNLSFLSQVLAGTWVSPDELPWTWRDRSARRRFRGLWPSSSMGAIIPAPHIHCSGLPAVVLAFAFACVVIYCVVCFRSSLPFPDPDGYEVEFVFLHFCFVYTLLWSVTWWTLFISTDCRKAHISMFTIETAFFFFTSVLNVVVSTPRNVVWT